MISFLSFSIWSLNSLAKDVDPWPWSIRMPFPWDNIEGTWTERNSRFTFSFKVVHNTHGEKHILIKHLDPENGAILAQGIGIENSEKVVVAGMTSGDKGQYRLTVRALKNIYSWGTQEFTGVTIESFDDELLFHFEIRKINDLPLTPSKKQRYKDHRCESIFKDTL